MRRAGLLVLFALAGCSGDAQSGGKHSSRSSDLESAAIERGVIRDPGDTDPVGLYARDTNRLCVLPAKREYRVGVFVDYGEALTCSGSGTAQRDGEALHLAFANGCKFEARFDGQHVRFPGALPDGCASLCRGRASLAGLEVGRLSGSKSEASALRDARGRLLCETGADD
ncbi:hypothetical protein [Stakelama marina]|uniref:Lipoprotein n=1 Tax=Stakelama marina TaxID=2826939 RepID=A0A8T4ICI3_9SPHN|nr:hypothetical protein [Stakelama marina]MBR0551812.1 hypothetical protein [Stakelama marina]